MKTNRDRTGTLPMGWPALFTASLLVFALSACDGVWPFESTNPDPHPPTLTNFQYSPVNLETGQGIQGSFTYIDPGADIETFEMRDLTGSEGLLPVPLLPDTGDEEDEEDTGTSVFFFPGRTGSIEWEMAVDSNQGGQHRIQAWLTDSKDSRSNIVEFRITVSPPGTL